MSKKIKINIGAGVANKKGWICVDKFVSEEAIKRQIKAGSNQARWEKGGEYIQADICNMPFPDNYADVVEAHQILEHLGFREIIPALKEVYRIMKPGATFTLDVPGMDGLALDWIEMSLENHNIETFDMDAYVNVMETIYGNQLGEGETHKSAFTQPFLNVCLVAAGFSQGEFSLYRKHSPTPQLGELGNPKGQLRHEVIAATVTK